MSLENLFAQVQEGAIQELNLVLKGDVQGSVEALLGELTKIQHTEVGVNVIHTGVGGITENDVNLAAASNALVVGFNVRPSAEAKALAEREGVDIRTYRVIYQLTDDIQQALVGMLSPVKTEETIGEAEVRALFRVSRLGTIAGCMVTQGVIRRNAQVRIVRDGTVIHETSIAQLKRFKDDVREVAEGFEAASCSTASTTSRMATSSRRSRSARSSAPSSRTPRLRRRLLRRPRNRASRGDPSVALGHEQAFASRAGGASLVAGGAGMDAVAPKPARVLGGEGCPVEDS